MTDVPDADPTARTGDPIGGDDGEPAGAPTLPHPDPEQVMDLLADHVPLALLMDLVTPDGPASADILRDEGMPDDAWWEPDDAASADPASDRSSDEGPGF